MIACRVAADTVASTPKSATSVSFVVQKNPTSNMKIAVVGLGYVGFAAGDAVRAVVRERAGDRCRSQKSRAAKTKDMATSSILNTQPSQIWSVPESLYRLAVASRGTWFDEC